MASLGLRLRSSAQYFDPFKFVTYTELIGRQHKGILAEPVRERRSRVMEVILVWLYER